MGASIWGLLLSLRLFSFKACQTSGINCRMPALVFFMSTLFPLTWALPDEKKEPSEDQELAQRSRAYACWSRSYLMQSAGSTRGSLLR